MIIKLPPTFLASLVESTLFYESWIVVIFVQRCCFKTSFLFKQTKQKIFWHKIIIELWLLT